MSFATLPLVGPLAGEDGPLDIAGDDTADFVAYVHETVANGVARTALLLRADRLPSHLSRPHHLRLVTDAILPLTIADRARVFHLPGRRIAVLWRPDASGALDATLAGLRHLLADAPPDAPDLAELARVFSLPNGAASLLRDAHFAPDDLNAATAHPEAPAPAKPPLDPSGLVRLEQALSQTDVASFVRRRPVCEVTPTRTRLAWEKRLLSVSDIGATLMPARDLRADRWLFRRLTRTLDRRMLTLLSVPGELRNARPFSLDLNVASILSPDFLRFDAALPANLRGEVTLNLLPPDIFADPAAFTFARGFVRARGYRLLLRGLTATLLDFLSVEQLGVDNASVPWSDALTGIDPARLSARAGDPAQIVLAAVETDAAIRWGLAQGIGLFQGPAVAAQV